MAGYYQADGVLEAELSALMDLPDPSIAAKFGLADAAGAYSDGLTERQLAAPATLAGTDVSSWLYDYYYRIWILPAETDFDAVAGTVTRSVNVWNTFFTPAQLQQLIGADDEGISWSGMPALPWSLNALGWYEVNHVASDAGPAVISARFEWRFDVATVRTTAVGLRAVMIPHKPNWAKPVDVARIWDTEISEGIDGSEGRESLAPRARLAVRYQILCVSGAESAVLRRVLRRLGVLAAGVPLWPDAVLVTATAGIGATQIAVEDTTGSRFGQVARVAIWVGLSDVRIADLAGVAANALTLEDALVAEVPAGAWIAPALFGRIDREARGQNATDDNLILNVDFEELF